MSAPTGGGLANDPFGNNDSQPQDPFAPSPAASQAALTNADPFGSGSNRGVTPPASTTDIFSAPAPAAPRTPVTGPWYFIIPAFISVMIAAVLAILAFAVGGSATDSMFHNYAIMGWAMAGIVGFLLLGMHMRADNRRQAESFYIENPMQYVLTRATIIIGSCAVVGTAFEIALWLSKTVG